MTTHRGNQLLWFVEHLYEFHSHDTYGFNNIGPDEAQARCLRWMDAVLPPPEKKPEPEPIYIDDDEIELPGSQPPQPSAVTQ
jgi:hypothetical protein